MPPQPQPQYMPQQYSQAQYVQPMQYAPQALPEPVTGPHAPMQTVSSVNIQVDYILLVLGIFFYPLWFVTVYRDMTDQDPRLSTLAKIDMVLGMIAVFFSFFALLSVVLLMYLPLALYLSYVVILPLMFLWIFC